MSDETWATLGKIFTFGFFGGIFTFFIKYLYKTYWDTNLYKHKVLLLQKENFNLQENFETWENMYTELFRERNELLREISSLKEDKGKKQNE